MNSLYAAVPSAMYGFPRSSLCQPLRHKAALGTDRHDNGVLHLLRLDQSEDLGAEVLWPIRPADAAARDLAEAQMHPLDPGRVHENFVERARGGHTLERTAPELQRDEMFRQPIGVDLIEIGAKGGLHRVDEAAQDAILIEAFDLPQRGFDGCDDLGLACLALVRRLIGARIEARSGTDVRYRRRWPNA